jgi:murein DD-endopeptidase MepM/ murein hydrolase activator NlpD
MFPLLSWLYERAARVYAFFGYLYDQIRDAAINAYAWARNAASDAYRWARDYTLYYYDRAKQRIAEALQSAWNTTIQYYNYAVTWIENVRNWLLERILHYYNQAVSTAQLLYNGTVALIQQAISSVKNGLENLIYYGSQAAEWALEKLRVYFEDKTTQIETAIDTLKTAVGANTDEGMANLVTLFSNPVGWVYAVLFDRFIEFLCFQLARGLGTVKYELPPAPTFISSGGSSHTPGNPPPGTEGLSSPLGSLYISGYTFDNPPGHKGVDFGLQNGDPVYAIHDGIIQAAGWSSVGYGFQVVIQGDIYWSRYAHFGSEIVDIGQRIRAGEVIGLGDSTGNSSGPHLHLEMKRLGAWIDPLSVL